MNGLRRWMLRVSCVPMVVAGLASGAAAADPPAPCPQASVPPLPLGRVKEAIAAGREVTIVAVGSSSTEGVQASDARHTYPAILQDELEAMLPAAHIAVLNRGVGGEDAAEMLIRLKRDAVVIRPTLVIWQVGANGAMRHTDPDAFRRMIIAGVQQLQDGQMDIVLMDNQRAPSILASPNHVALEGMLADVAALSDVGLFGRGDLMDQWRATGHPYDEFISGDGVHHNDRGYRCVAQALATAIVTGLEQQAPAATRRSVGR